MFTNYLIRVQNALALTVIIIQKVQKNTLSLRSSLSTQKAM